MPRRRRREHERGPSLAGMAGVMAGFPLAYLAAEGTLSGNRHPLHWGIAGAGAVVGYVGVDLVTRLREQRMLRSLKQAQKRRSDRDRSDGPRRGGR